jgi:hypothetical protein
MLRARVLGLIAQKYESLERELLALVAPEHASFATGRCFTRAERELKWALDILQDPSGVLRVGNVYFGLDPEWLNPRKGLFKFGLFKQRGMRLMVNELRLAGKTVAFVDPALTTRLEDLLCSLQGFHTANLRTFQQWGVEALPSDSDSDSDDDPPTILLGFSDEVELEYVLHQDLEDLITSHVEAANMVLAAHTLLQLPPPLLELTCMYLSDVCCLALAQRVLLHNP